MSDRSQVDEAASAAADSRQAGPVDPLVSVIVPSYNTANLVGECLDSIFAQTYKNFEVVLVNDGSPDTPALEKALEPYMPRIVYIRQENKRAAGARNTAIRKARGEFLAFLDSDDRWLPDHLASQMKLLQEDPSLDLVYANAALFRGNRERGAFMDRCPSNGPATFEALIYERCQVSVSTVVVKKSALIKAGLFDENLARCDDYDMWVRAAFHGAKIAYSRKIQARCDDGRDGSLGQSAARMAEAYLIILEKLRRTLPLDSQSKEMISKRIIEVRANYRLEEGKLQLWQGKYREARQAFDEANQHFHSPKLSLVLAGLRAAPGPTAKLAAWWHAFQMRSSG
jgi:glycosyltransferase involved in cell wall biosynthesis